MNEIELIQRLHNYNESELFYKKYQAVKGNDAAFRKFIAELDVSECIRKHFIIPELPETMPPAMLDEYIFTDPDVGMVIDKHNCYSPEFLHFHTYFEAFYVYEGTCIHEIGGIRKTLRMGDFCIIPPGVSHSISVQDSSVIINMIMSSGVIDNTFKNPTYYKNNPLSDFFLKNMFFSSSNSFLTFHTGNDRELKELLLQMMLESANKYREYDAILYSCFGIFFAKLLRYYEDTVEVNGGSTKKETFAYEVNKYIQEHHQNITLDKVAEYFSYTPEYLSRLIKQTTGKKFSDIVLESRMRHAVSLLKSTNLTVHEISWQTGYENTENFIRAFKKIYKKTPTEYRRSLDKL